jgi:hypothetical protein
MVCLLFCAAIPQFPKHHPMSEHSTHSLTLIEIGYSQLMMLLSQRISPTS